MHGVLHLLGYDHADPEQEREMFGLQAGCSPTGAPRGEQAAARAAQRRSDSAVLGTVGPRGQLTAAWTHLPLIVIAVLLVPLAGLFAAADAALNSVSRARVDALVGPADRARGRLPRSSPTGRGTSTCCCCCGWPPRPPPRCCSPSR